MTAAGARWRPRHRSRREWSELALAVIVTGAALAPIVVVIVQRAGRPYLPVQDQAVLDMRVRDVWSFSANTPLTGPYSRFGWDHPGPLMYYALALFSGAMGEAPWATMVGNALVQAVAIIWICRLAYKTGGLTRQIPWTAVVVLSYWATGPWILQEAWNPHEAFPFFTLLLLQAWLVAQGDTARLPGLAFVASFLVQTHIGYALPVLIIGCYALVRLVSAERRAGRGAARWRLWRGPVGLVAALWFIPVVLDTALHFPGNTTTLVKFYLGLDHQNRQPLLGLHQGLGYLATEFRWRPPWLGGADPVDPFTGLARPSSVAWLVIPVVLVVAAFWAARRRQREDLRLLAELLAVTGVAGAVTLALVRGDPSPYLFYWRITIGAATVVLSLVVLAGSLSLPPRTAASLVERPRARLSLRGLRQGASLSNALNVLLLAILVAGSASFTSSVAAADGPVSPMAAVVGAFLRDFHQEGVPSGSIILQADGTTLGGLQGGLFDALVRDGRRVFAREGLGYQFGYGRQAQPLQVGSVWYVSEESQLYSLLSADPGARVLAVSSDLPAAKLAELVAIQRRAAVVLVRDDRTSELPDLGSTFAAYLLGRTPGLSSHMLAVLQALDAEVGEGPCLCSVIAFPPRHLPPLEAGT